jgi:hypothetical protein
MATRQYDDDVIEVEREVNDQPVTVTVVDTDDDGRIIVRADTKYEFVVDDEWAYPKWDQSLPRWMESLLADFGVRGIRTGFRGEK